jgi:hypothetical protein
MSKKRLDYHQFPYYREPKALYLSSLIFAAAVLAFAIMIKFDLGKRAISDFIEPLTMALNIEAMDAYYVSLVMGLAVVLGCLIGSFRKSEKYKDFYEHQLSTLNHDDMLIILGQNKDERTLRAIIKYLAEWQVTYRAERNARRQEEMLSASSAMCDETDEGGEDYQMLGESDCDPESEEECIDELDQDIDESLVDEDLERK